MENALAPLPIGRFGETHTEEVLDANQVKTDTSLERLIRYYTASEEATDKARRKSERDRDYVDGKQLTQAEYDALDDRGQPPIAFNIIRSRVEFLQGLEKKQRRDPKAYPRNNPDDVDAADAFTDAMRYCIEAADYPSARSRAWDNICVEGFGGVEVSAEQRRDGQYQFNITAIPWDRLGYDPHSVAHDFSDAKYLFQVLWLDEDDALARYQGNENAPSILTASFNDGGSALSQTYDDKPRWTVWADGRRKRVRIVMMWYREGAQWRYCEFTKAGKLLDMDGAYVDEFGDTYCPWVVESDHIDRDNNRYGEVRDFIDPQDEVNKRRSKALHLVNTKGVIAEQGAVADVAATRTELTRADFFVETLPGSKFEIVQGSSMASDQMALLENAMNFVAQNGPNNALLGRGVEDQSGRAIEAQQQGGLIERGNLLDSLRRLDRRVFRIIALMIKQFWSAETWFRATDNPETPRYVGLNVPKPVTEPRQDMRTGQVYEVPVIDPWTGQPKVEIQNNVAMLDLDIIVTDAPDVITLAGENYSAFIDLMKAGLPPPLLKIAIEMNPSLSAKVKKRLTEMVDQLAAQAQQAPPQPSPEQQMLMKVQLDEKVAGIRNKDADTKNKLATADKNQADAMATRASIAPPTVIPVPVPVRPPPGPMDASTALGSEY